MNNIIVPNWHPLFVHFPIALLVAAAGLLAAAFFWKEGAVRSKLYQSGLINLWLGTVGAGAAIATGLYASLTVQHDELGHMAITRHMHWALLTLALSLLTAAVAIRFRRKDRPTTLMLALALLCAAAVGVTGYLGGENVFRHGIGVMRLPGAAEHHHHSLFDQDGDHE
ncbi:MAG: DUF2231 domain-containing protein [Alphaproteobacteria bacterium]|nr:DUF2231 domain-containing protein [Alphaproteobacteria bacterium]